MTTVPLPCPTVDIPVSYPALSIDSNCRLSVRLDADSNSIKVRPMRLFPLTDPDHWIALLDMRGAEVICIEDTTVLSLISQQALNIAIGTCEFVPQILRILRVSSNNVPCQWEVETDRGDTVFILKDEKDVRALAGGRILIIDGHGIRYHIPQLASLDSYSRRIIEWYV